MRSIRKTKTMGRWASGPSLPDSRRSQWQATCPPAPTEAQGPSPHITPGCRTGIQAAASCDVARRRSAKIPLLTNAPLRKDALSGPHPHRTGHRKVQTLQTHRPALQENRHKLQILHRSRCRLHLDQIRPQDLKTRWLCGVRLMQLRRNARYTPPASHKSRIDL